MDWCRCLSRVDVQTKLLLATIWCGPSRKDMVVVPGVGKGWSVEQVLIYRG